MKYFIEPHTWLRHDLLPEILLSRSIETIAQNLKIRPAQFIDEGANVDAFGVELSGDDIFFVVAQKNEQEITASVYVPKEYCRNDHVKEKILHALGEI
jgi:hypothetical protein